MDKLLACMNIFKIFCTLQHLKNKKPTRCCLLFYYTSYRLKMFRALLCPSSGARDYDVDYHIGRIVLALLYVGCWVRLEWCPGYRLKHLSL